MRHAFLTIADADSAAGRRRHPAQRGHHTGTAAGCGPDIDDRGRRTEPASTAAG